MPHRPHRSRWILPLALLALAACGEGSTAGPGDGGDITPTPTAVGQPTGAAVTATIGAEGGALESADGKLRVEVPAGAVTAATTFSVQPIESKAWGALAGGIGAYRLEPHGTTFAKPVRLTFHYGAADLAGTAPALLRLASQDDQGYWRIWRQATVDAAAHTIALDAPHFSDWSLITGARLFADRSTVETGTTTALHVRDCRMAEPDDDLLVPLLYECKDAGVYGAKATNWSVRGVEGGTSTYGRIVKRDAEPGTADFHAPAEVPDPSTVAVSVEYTGTDPKDHGLLVTDVTIVEQGNACAPLRDVERWTANVGFNYSFSGTNADGEQLTLAHAAEFATTLVKFSEGPGGVSYIGTVTGTTSVNDREVVPIPNSPPFVTTLVGSGAPANDAEAPENLAHVYLNINLDECTYNSGVVSWVEATETETDGSPYTSDRHVGAVRTADRPITSLTSASFTGSADMLAHSETWGSDNDGDGYFPGGLGEALFGKAYKPEGQAGTARVEWTFAPVK